MGNKDENKIEKNEQSIGETAINHKETHGKKTNHQVKQREEKHQPRDNA